MNTPEQEMTDAFEAIKASQAQKRAERQEAAVVARSTRLAREIIAAANEKVPAGKGGVVLDLSYWSARKFKKTFALPHDFPARQTRLVVRNEYTSWARMTPEIAVPGEDVVALPAFLATKSGLADSYQRLESPSHLFMEQQDGVATPVEFGDENYAYIRKVASVFLLSIANLANYDRV